MNNSENQISVSELYQIIGQKEVVIFKLEQKIQQLLQQVKSLENQLEEEIRVGERGA